MRTKNEINQAVAILTRKADRPSLVQAEVLQGSMTEQQVFQKYVMEVAEENRDEVVFFAARDVELRNVHPVFIFTVTGETLVQLWDQERQAINIAEHTFRFRQLHCPYLFIRRVQPFQQLPRLVHRQFPAACRTSGSEFIDASMPGIVIHTDAVESGVQGFELLDTDRFVFIRSHHSKSVFLRNKFPLLPARYHSILSGL